MKTPFGKAVAGQQSRTGTEHTSVSVTMMKRKAAHKKLKSRPTSQPQRNIWKGTVLDQVLVNPSLNLIKYDGFDCVYGLELHRDERVSSLEVLPNRVASSRITVEHIFETEEGSKNEGRGMVLAQAPVMNIWFYITYEKDPGAGEVVDSLVGKQVEYTKDDGSKRSSMVIHQVEAKPCVLHQT
ncbi:unnamed protein product [Nyctereutes procyonoides]|uniref:(raccoon dog) hypothetical protein n=1 Tax=Nyctereutes procyonoides TaxID=34880 RepID=A0A811Z1F8_NYCPR|nr:unnamed protein product [Nyctereutes procyonoides]